jgi:hypothetical protein
MNRQLGNMSPIGWRSSLLYRVKLLKGVCSGISCNRWTTGAVYEPQVNLEDPPVGPQEEADASPFEEEKLEIIFSGFFSPQ